jgi:hypothetical protein
VFSMKEIERLFKHLLPVADNTAVKNYDLLGTKKNMGNFTTGRVHYDLFLVSPRHKGKIGQQLWSGETAAVQGAAENYLGGTQLSCLALAFASSTVFGVAEGLSGVEPALFGDLA